MRLEEITLLVFTAFNVVRLVAYVPQIRKAACDQNGASAIAYSTWVMFFFAHASTVAYALVNQKDASLALWFTANAACCLAIIGAGLLARRRSRARLNA
ncbi:hypothetical protein GJW-30_1_02107 [Variibacter gotjawalensis]|uniref:PQ loop repeat protein n=1 Tax=Variibacter gotjawalensis TaxID=1333996 RepID=A0A0S3PUD6_9BRAD|nr:hypothetical protein [Variibacter gotjawalensis]NIK49900.1 uncharacterized protein with PQ loop repeat [Variibacter gotjawalensis]RZS45899.1 hypothetical protein EV661_4225 [Variibacter gotjawalensis]BAT59574.1 hypothetical protein GJW-30_1_02107 [Variibacter gotjawalensis]